MANQRLVSIWLEAQTKLVRIKILHWLTIPLWNCVFCCWWTLIKCWINNSHGCYCKHECRCRHHNPRAVARMMILQHITTIYNNHQQPRSRRECFARHILLIKLIEPRGWPNIDSRKQPECSEWYWMILDVFSSQQVRLSCSRVSCLRALGPLEPVRHASHVLFERCSHVCNTLRISSYLPISFFAGLRHVHALSPDSASDPFRSPWFWAVSLFELSVSTLRLCIRCNGMESTRDENSFRRGECGVWWPGWQTPDRKVEDGFHRHLNDFKLL